MTYKEVYPGSFRYDRMRYQIKADTAGYSFLCSKYSRPSRADTFLAKRLNGHFNRSFGNIYKEGQTVVFTVKAQRYRVYALCLPWRPIEPWDNFDIGVLIGDKTKEYRFFDTAEEAFHHRALRDLAPPAPELLDIGHLQHKEWKPIMGIIDLKVALHAETDKAYRVSLDGNQKKAVWIPKSQVEFFENTGGEVVDISIPEWLAYEKKLI